MDLRLFALVFSAFIQYTIFSMPSPFFPVQAQDQGIPLYMIGIILASFAVSSIITAPIVGQYLEQIGRRRAFVTSMIISGAGICVWGILPFVGYGAFLGIAFFGRLLQGVGFTISTVTGLSIAASDYPESIGKVLSYIEMTGGLGMIAGPLVGALIFYFAGFAITFFAYSCLFFAVTPLFWFMLGPDRPYVKYEQTKQISLVEITFKGLIFLQIVVYSILWFGYTALDAVLAIFLNDEFGLDGSIIGLIFGVGVIAYVIGSVIAGFLLNNYAKYKLVAVGGFIAGVSSLLMGPCTSCEIPVLLWIVIVGLFGYGLGAAFAYIPILPFMIELACERYGYQNDDILSDTLSASMTTAGSLVTLVSPILSAVWVQYWSFENLYTVIGGVTIIFTIIYTVIFATQVNPAEKLLDDEKWLESASVNSDAN